MKKYFIIIIVFISNFIFAQNSDDCLTKNQLFRMNNTSLTDINYFLKNENWSLKGSQTNQKIKYNSDDINFDEISWNRNYFSNQNLIILHIPNQKNIILYQPNSYCYNQLLKGFNSVSGKTELVNNGLKIKFIENSIEIEFIEKLNISNKKIYLISIYGSNSLEKNIYNSYYPILKRSGNSNGDDPGTTGDKGQQDGDINNNGLYAGPKGKFGGSGGGDGGGEGLGLNLVGWKLKSAPIVNDNSSETGIIKFSIKIDDSGNIISLQTVESTLSVSVSKKYKDAVAKLKFIPATGGVRAKISSGTIVFNIKNDSSPNAKFPNSSNVEPTKEEEEQIFTAVEQMPEFPGGPSAFARYLMKNLRYPDSAQRAKVQGRVYVQFVVNIDGSIQDIKVLKSVGFGCDEEAMRVIQNGPKWNPGKQSGRTVRSRFTQPITFQLSE